MNPFCLILTTYADGEMGANDPRWTLDDAADEFAELEKLSPVSRKVLLIDGTPGMVADVTRTVEMILIERAHRRDAA